MYKASFQVLGALIVGTLAMPVVAEPLSLRCHFTESTFSAPFMVAPQTRPCPQADCYYDLDFDSDGGVAAVVNGISGYRVEQGASDVILQRSVRNPIVKGQDSARFRVNRESLTFSSERTTPPSVSLKAQGQCEYRATP